ncbi:MAG TPA: hypothetical protein VGJ28_11400 [Micromonosporaceae bacterium]
MSRSVAGIALSLASLTMFVPHSVTPAAKPVPVAQWHSSGIVVTLRVKPMASETAAR